MRMRHASALRSQLVIPREGVESEDPSTDYITNLKSDPERGS